MIGKNARLHINTDIILDKETYNVDFTATNISIGNSGIGSYEFWGMKGNDRGHNFVEEFTVSDLKVKVYDKDDKLEEKEVTGQFLLNRLINRITDAIEESEEIQEQLDEHFCSPPSREDYNDN